MSTRTIYAEGLMMHEVTVYISAGGRGTRLNELFEPHPTLGITKALLRPRPDGPTLVEHQINSILETSPANVVVNVGDHSHVTGYLELIYPCSAVSSAGTAVQLESGGELLHAIHKYPHQFQSQIVVVNVDTLITLPLQQLVDAHRRNPGSLTLALTRLPGVPNENSMWIAPDGRILYNAELYSNPMRPDEASSRTLYRASSAGAVVVEAEFLRQIDWTPEAGQVSLYRGIMELAVRMQEAYGYDNGLNPFMDVGTVSTWQEVAANPRIIDAYLRYRDA